MRGTVLWSGGCASRGLALLGFGSALVLIALGIGTAIALAGAGAPVWVGWLVAAVGLGVGALGWLLSSLDVRISPDSFTVAFGPWGRPRRVIALSDIADASAIQVEPMEWGGWGYRWIPGRGPRPRSSGAVRASRSCCTTDDGSR